MVVAAVLITDPVFVAAALGVPAGQSRSATTSEFSILSARAEAALAAGRLDDAAPLYRKALAVRPDWKEGWWALGTDLEPGRRPGLPLSLPPASSAAAPTAVTKRPGSQCISSGQ